MKDGNLFPELASEPQPEINSDGLAPDPDTIASPSNPGPLPPLVVPTEELTPPLITEPENLRLSDSSVPPDFPPDGSGASIPAPKGKQPGSFWLWAAPVLLLLLVLFAVGVRAFIVRGIADISLDVVRPRSGESVVLGQPISVVARIRSSNGWSKANFYVNNLLLRTITATQDSTFDQELSFAWTPSVEGATMLRVQVTNQKGNQTAAEDVAILVVNSQNGPSSTPLPVPSPTITLTPPTKGPSPTPCTDLFEIISESGLAMGTQMDIARPFTKSWMIKNLGSCRWEKYKFVFVSGSLLGASTPVDIPTTDPGGIAVLDLSLLSPSIDGNFIGKWRVQNARGDLFGPELVYGLVIPSPTPTITPTKTDTPTPRPTNTPRPSFTPTASKTFTPTLTSTITPTFTATLTETPTATNTEVPTTTYTLTPEPPTETPLPTNWVVVTEEYTTTPGTLLYRPTIIIETFIPMPMETPQP